MTLYENVKLTRVGLLVHQAINCCLSSVSYSILLDHVCRNFTGIICV